MKKKLLVLVVGLVGVTLFFSNMSNADKVVPGQWMLAKSLTSLTMSELEVGDQAVRVRKLLESNERLVLEYALPELKTIPATYCIERGDLDEDNSPLDNFVDKEFENVKMGSTPVSARSGEPMLPFVSSNIIVPKGYAVKQVRMVPGKMVELPGDHLVEPASMPFPRIPGITITKTLPKESIYNVDASFPHQNVEVIGTQSSRGIPVFIANLFPVKYNPLKRKLYYTKFFKLVFEFEPDQSTEGNLVCRPSPLFPIQRKVENPEAFEEYKNNCQAQARSNPSYLIITDDEIAGDSGSNSIADFQSHKSDFGIIAVIETIENITSSYSGVDDAERIRNYIIDRYNEWGVEFVLLVGDTQILEERQLWVVANDPDSPYDPYIDNMPSDLYFSCLDGSYNEDGDDRWGEPEDGPGGQDVDLFADVYVGRASADDASEVSNWVHKTTEFENDDPEGVFKRNNFMVGEYLGFGGPAEYAKGHLEQIVHGADFGGYLTYGFDADPSYSTETLYQADTYWGASTLIGEMNSNTHAWLNHLGHASTDYVMQLSEWDVMDLNNTKYFFAYSQGCYAGSFDSGDCMAEIFTTGADGGAFGCVFNARYGFGLSNSLDGPSNRYHRQFWDAVFGENLSVLGQIQADHKEDLVAHINEDVMRWVYYQTNFFGDPSISIVANGQPDLDTDTDTDTDSDSDTDSDTDTDTDADSDSDTDTDSDSDTDGDDSDSSEDDSCGCRKVGYGYDHYSLIELLQNIL